MSHKLIIIFEMNGDNLINEMKILNIPFHLIFSDCLLIFFMCYRVFTLCCFLKRTNQASASIEKCRRRLAENNCSVAASCGLKTRGKLKCQMVALGNFHIKVGSGKYHTNGQLCGTRFAIAVSPLA